MLTTILKNWIWSDKGKEKFLLKKLIKKKMFERYIYEPSDFEHFKNTLLIFCIFREKRQKVLFFSIFSNVRRSCLVIKFNDHLIVVQWTLKISCKKLFFFNNFFLFLFVVSGKNFNRENVRKTLNFCSIFQL